MSGIRITCEIKGNSSCLRTLDIPEALTFLDLHEGLSLAFGLMDNEVHHFTVGESNIPVTFDEDEDLQAIAEGDLCVVNILREGETINYYSMVEDRDVSITIKKNRLLPSYKSRQISLQNAIGSPFADADLADEVPGGKSDEPDVESIKELLEDFIPDCMGTSAPDLDRFAELALEHADNALNSAGLDMKSLFDKMDRKGESRPVLPPPPKKPDKKTAFYENLDLAKEWHEKHPDDTVRVITGDKTIVDYLSGLGAVGLYDYCKYLYLYEELKLSEKKKAAAIYQLYEDEPELLLYPLTGEEREELLSFASSAQENISCRSGSLASFVLLGLGKFSPEEEALILAKDAVNVIRKLEDRQVRKTAELIDDFDEGFRVLLKHYGIMEVDAVPQLLQKYFALHIPRKLCSRLIYWRYSLQGDIVTFSFESPSDLYCAEKGLVLKKIMPQLNIVQNFFPYADMGAHELEEWKNTGDYMNVYSGWGFLLGFLIMNGRQKPEYAREICDNIYREVRNGANLKACMEMLGVNEGGNSLQVPRMMLWEHCLHFVLGTSLPAMKGANRIIAHRDVAYSMCLAAGFAGETVKEDKIMPETHIEDMPEDMQIDLGSRLFTLEESDLQPIRRMLRRCANNADLNYIAGIAYQRLGYFEEALPFLERVDKILKGKDESIKSVISACKTHQVMKPIGIRTVDGNTYLYS